ncbi:hypothetical protein HYS72_02060 [Candidatus Pacearchaeota archaeon]|nr:hypothetical protein [Candidatus Pacearchaeota archaeon]MBI2056912.1 hypothetical protein [Candidatus Pacearchaeota archaeon]
MKKKKSTAKKLSEMLIGATMLGIAITGVASNKKSNDNFLKEKYETDSIYQAKHNSLENFYMDQKDSLDNLYMTQKTSLEGWYLAKKLENEQKYRRSF